MNQEEQCTVDNFHELYYNGAQGEIPLFARTSWMGYPCLKCPLDMWVYQEIISERKPDLIIETGTHKGGSALFMANMLDLIGKGEIISIDTEVYDNRPLHPRINYITGSSTDKDLVFPYLINHQSKSRLLILDSDHSKKHVLDELQVLSQFLRVGDYLIVEDTNINGHPTYSEFGEGPYEAVQEFLQNNKDFQIDKSREKFLMTFNPNGYLKKIS